MLPLQLHMHMHYSKRVGREFPGVVADLCVMNTGPMLIAVSITEMVILYNFVAPAGFWPRGQNPRRHPRIPRVYTYKEFQNVRK